MDINKIKKNKNKIIGKQIEYYSEISSTHKYANYIAQNNKINGKLIIADKQTDGIGTKGRLWHTEDEDNIALTVITYPKCNVQELKTLTIDIAKCMKKAIKDLYDIELTIKEPNDLMLNSKKIGGILTQINTRAEKIEYLLISIGFNVNKEHFTKDIQDIATSLKKEYNKKFETEEIIIEFLQNLEKCIINLI